MTTGPRVGWLRTGASLFIFATCCSNGDLGAARASSAREGVAQLAAPLDADGGTSVNFVAQELVGRPSDHSIAMKAIADQSVEAYLEYGLQSGEYASSSVQATFTDGVIEVDLDGLAPNTTYFYRLRYRIAGSSDDFAARSEHRFVTRRAPESTFTFDVQSDSHQGYAAFYTSALYGVTMQNMANDQPDLLFDLGDAVSTDDAVETEDTVRQKYENQRAYFDIVGHSSSVFLVLGNHENEEGWNLDDMGDDRADSLPVLGANGRKRYFLNPVPDGFYTGNSEPVPELDGDHLRGDYYAFEWGSALFVAIDPFWYTLTKPYAGAIGGEKDDEVVGNRWDWTLGKDQYDWLTRTLAGSTQPFKFVFSHHPTGGTADYVRGGAKAAQYCEWGGYDTDGTTWGFDTNRPGWAMPVHQLLAQNGVTAFIHGHDHVFAKEELDGVVYQECPQPADSHYGTGFSTNAQDYAGAEVLHNSGHLRVTVSPVAVKVEYVRAFLAGDGDNGSVAYSYTISPCAAVNSDGRACDDGNACTLNDTCASGTCAGTPTTCATSGGAAGASAEGGAAGETEVASAGQCDAAETPTTIAGNGGEPSQPTHGGPKGAPSNASTPPHDSGSTSHGGRLGLGGSGNQEQGGAEEVGASGETSGPQTGTGGSRNAARAEPAVAKASRGCACGVARDDGHPTLSLGVLLAFAAAGGRRGARSRGPRRKTASY